MNIGARKAARGIAAALVVAAACAAGPAEADDALWAALRSGGHVVMIRHAATEPGVGDPPNFRLGDCATQRNLSPTGRLEAKRLGEAFRARGVAVTEVLSSEWCRCRDTAAIAFGGYMAWSPLNSFFGDRSLEPARTRAVRERAAAWTGPGNLVLVTHQVNISALAGTFVVPGEVVVLKPASGDKLEFMGKLAPERTSN
ncbi:MAG: histidine phosphatase family protein [Burkholderiales bacterium]|jgi:broad specificity phosphatase PhoE|nr:histidine phosphatase family protein [Burkholderiales bacterium]